MAAIAGAGFFVDIYKICQSIADLYRKDDYSEFDTFIVGFFVLGLSDVWLTRWQPFYCAEKQSLGAKPQDEEEKEQLPIRFQRFQSIGTAPRGRHPRCRLCSSKSGMPSTLCLILTKTVLPPFQWLFLHSLKLEPISLMDQRIMRALPRLTGMLGWLERRSQISLFSMLVLSALAVLALSIPMTNRPCVSGGGKGVGKVSSRQELWSLTILIYTALFWNHEGGSALDFFLLGMPAALSVGISLGSLHESLRFPSLSGP